MRDPVSTTDAPEAIGPYSQAIRSGGLVFCSGQIPLDPATGSLVEGGIAEQTARVLDNVEAVLGAAGCSLGDVVKTTVFLRHLSDYTVMNEVYIECFGDHRPARSAIGVAELPLGALVELEAWAYVGGR
jgi:2-iminobutanoate/2-iminopropanoate deaminase